MVKTFTRLAATPDREPPASTAPARLVGARDGEGEGEGREKRKRKITEKVRQECLAGP